MSFLFNDKNPKYYLKNFFPLVSLILYSPDNLFVKAKQILYEVSELGELKNGSGNDPISPDFLWGQYHKRLIDRSQKFWVLCVQLGWPQFCWWDLLHTESFNLWHLFFELYFKTKSSSWLRLIYCSRRNLDWHLIHMVTQKRF